MKQQEVFKKIGTIVKELNDQYDYLLTLGDELNDLEMELFVANAHFLTDHAEILRKLNLQKIAAAAPIALPPIPAEPPVVREYEFPKPANQVIHKPTPELPKELPPPVVAEKEPEPVEVTSTKTEEEPAPQIDLQPYDVGSAFSFIRQEEPAEIRHELALNEADTWEDEEPEEVIDITPPAPPKPIEKPAPVFQQPIIPEKKEEPVFQQPVVPVKKEEPVKAEPVSVKAPEPVKEEEKPLTINQRMQAMLNDKGHSNHQQPVTDLKSAISLNDKLLYIKDLFNGYNLAYSEAIDLLNRFTTFEEADRFLKTNYATKNNWDSKRVTVDKLYDLLKRRYA